LANASLLADELLYEHIFTQLTNRLEFEGFSIIDLEYSN